MGRYRIFRNVLVLIVVCSRFALAQEPPTDALTRQLFEQYALG